MYTYIYIYTHIQAYICMYASRKSVGRGRLRCSSDNNNDNNNSNNNHMLLLLLLLLPIVMIIIIQTINITDITYQRQ